MISPTLPGLGLWLEQLVAESTGKQGRGILPVAEEPPGEPAAYANDRVFAHLTDSTSPQPQTQDRMEALAEAGHPVITIPTGGPADLGRVFLLAESFVAVAGWGLQINPFDQPDVQEAKDATNKVLAGFAESGELPKVAENPTAALHSLLLGAEPPEYVALMAYVRPSTRVRPRRRRAAGGGAGSQPRHHHLRLRPPLPALHRPVPQGRPEDRALPADHPRRAP